MKLIDIIQKKMYFNTECVEEIRNIIVNNKKLNINAQDYRGYSSLHYAVLINYFELVKLLLENGADPNIQNIFKQTPLHHTSKFTNLNIVKLLLESGADYTITDLKGKYGLHEFLDKNFENKLIEEFAILDIKYPGN